MGIVVIGATFVDIKGYPNGIYIPAGRNAGRVEHVHGGVCRNIAEDIANLELKPTFVSLVDDSASGTDVLEKLNRHQVNTHFIRQVPDGMGTWLAVFDHTGDVVASISKRPDLTEIGRILDEQGEEIFRDASGVVIEIDIDKELVKRAILWGQRYQIPIFAAVSNMSIAVERRDLIQKVQCFVCNQQEAGIFFAEDFSELTPAQMAEILPLKIKAAGVERMIVTMGAQGAAYADLHGESGVCPAQKVNVVDTTGAGDAFIAGVSVGLTHGKSLQEACRIGTRLSASVIGTKESVCPRFLPSEFDL